MSLPNIQTLDGQLSSPGASPELHPHPLRSHNSSTDVRAAAEPPCDRPDSPVLARSNPYNHRRSLSTFRSSCSSCNDFDAVPPVPPIPPGPFTPQEGLSYPPVSGSPTNDFPTIPVRPPLKPTISFGGVSRYSYYSNTPSMVELKAGVVVTEDEIRSSIEPSNSNIWIFNSCFASLCLSSFACGLSMTACSTALPAMAESLHLNAVQAFWVPASLFLVSSLTQPLFMRLSHAMGCKSLLLLGLALFTGGSLGSAMSRNIASMLWSQSLGGAGNGAICILTQLTLNQLTTPAHRSRYELATSLIVWLGAAMGPIIGGAAAQSVGWRCVFSIQAIFGGVGLLTIPFLLRLPYIGARPKLNWFLKVDILGWLLLVGSTAPIVVSLSVAGISLPWSSWRTVLPIVISAISLVAWAVYCRRCHNPILPLSILRNPSAAVSCFGSLVHGMLFTSIVYFIPIFLRITYFLDPTMAGAAISPWTLALVASALMTGAVLPYTGYRYTIWVGWALTTLTVSLNAILGTKTVTASCVLIGLVGGLALGLLAPSLNLAVQSTASNDDESIHASPLRHFFTTLGQCLGVTIGSSIFLNQLNRQLSINPVRAGSEAHYVQNAVALVNTIAEQQSTELATRLVTSYIDALHTVWIVMGSIAGLAFVLSIFFTEDHRRKTFLNRV